VLFVVDHWCLDFQIRG